MSEITLPVVRASSLERLYLCRGSYLFEKQFSEQGTSAVAEFGTRVHDALAGHIDEKLLDDDEFWMYAECQSIADRAFSRCFGYEKRRSAMEIYKEERYNLIDGAGNEILSGQVDLLWVDRSTRTGLVIDYKTGYTAVSDPPSNKQLRAYAVLAARNLDLVKVMVVVAQPRCSRDFVFCSYEGEDLLRAEQEIRSVIASAKVPGKPLVAGAKQCEYCNARPVCPTLREAALAAAKEAEKKTEIILVSNTEINARIHALSNEDLSEALDKVKLVDKFIEAIRNEALLRMRMGLLVPKYQLTRTKSKTSIAKDMYELYKKLQAAGLSPRQIFDIVSISKDALKKLVKGVTGLKGKSLDEEILLLTKDHLKPSETKPTIERLDDVEDPRAKILNQLNKDLEARIQEAEKDMLGDWLREGLERMNKATQSEEIVV